MTLSDLERRDDRGQIFHPDLLNNARSFGHTTAKFARMIHEKRRISGDQTRLRRKGAGPQRSPILGFPSISA